MFEHVRLAISRDKGNQREYSGNKRRWWERGPRHGETSVKFNRREGKLETGSLRSRIIPKFVGYNSARRKQGNKSYGRVYRWSLAVANNRRARLMSSIDTSNNRNEAWHGPWKRTWPYPPPPSPYPSLLKREQTGGIVISLLCPPPTWNAIRLRNDIRVLLYRLVTIRCSSVSRVSFSSLFVRAGFFPVHVHHPSPPPPAPFYDSVPRYLRIKIHSDRSAIYVRLPYVYLPFTPVFPSLFVPSRFPSFRRISFNFSHCLVADSRKSAAFWTEVESTWQTKNIFRKVILSLSWKFVSVRIREKLKKIF